MAWLAPAGGIEAAAAVLVEVTFCFVFFPVGARVVQARGSRDGENSKQKGKRVAWRVRRHRLFYLHVYTFMYMQSFSVWQHLGAFIALLRE